MMVWKDQNILSLLKIWRIKRGTFQISKNVKKQIKDIPAYLKAALNVVNSNTVGPPLSPKSRPAQIIQYFIFNFIHM